MEPLFLNDDQLKELTGRVVRRCQIESLRQMGIPFRVNAAGRPVVCRSAVEGGKSAATSASDSSWTPRVLHGKATN
jgi:hypothetical protein